MGRALVLLWITWGAWALSAHSVQILNSDPSFQKHHGAPAILESERATDARRDDKDPVAECFSGESFALRSITPVLVPESSDVHRTISVTALDQRPPPHKPFA